MKLRHSATAVVVALSVGTTIGALAQTAAPASRLGAVHDRTIAAAARAHDTGAAATQALCGQDRALQARSRAAADTAQRDLQAAAQAEAEERPDVAQAHYEAIGAGLAANGNHLPAEMQRLKNDADAKSEAYARLKDATALSIMEAALQSAAPSGNPRCPPPQQRAQPSPIPPLPPTPSRAIGMLRGFSDPAFKATLAQPGLRGRVETLMGLEGCDWTVSANASSQAITRQAGAYLNRMNDDDLRATLNDSVLLDRVDAAFGRGNCAFTPQTGSTVPFPETNTNQNADPGPYPYGYPNYPGTNPGVPNIGSPGVLYGTPYGGYGGYGPGYRR